MDGRVRFSLHLPSTALKARGGLQLKDGEILSVRVDGEAADGRYSVIIKGTSLSIRSKVNLQVGVVLKARVTEKDGRVELTVLQSPLASAPGNVASLVERVAPSNLPEDFASLVVQSLRRSSMPVTPEAVAAVSSMIPHLRRKNPTFIRFATILHDKNLHVTQQELEELFRAVCGEGDVSGRSGGRPGERHERKDGDFSEKSAGEATKVQSELSQEIGAQFKTQSMGGSERDVGCTALFNHVGGKHEDWVVVPFRVGDARAEIDGSVRVLLDLPRTRNIPPVRVTKAAVAVNGIGAFEIRGNPPNRIVFHAESLPDKFGIEGFLPELREKLRNLGVEIDDTNNGGAVYDGFSAETHEIRGVDATA